MVKLFINKRQVQVYTDKKKAKKFATRIMKAGRRPIVNKARGVYFVGIRKKKKR